MARQDTQLGILLVLASCGIFALQDAVSRHLGQTYPIYMVVMIRFWFFAAFVVALAARREGLRAAARTRFPLLQAARGVLLVAEIAVMVLAFVKLGLVATHALFITYPLLVAALSGPVLGEKVGWRRWAAIGAGFLGVLVILQPGSGVLSPWAPVPLAAAFLFALYGLATRYVARGGDSAGVSFLWAGIVGAIAITPLGLWHWQPMAPADWIWMAVLCVTGASGHWLLIRAYEVAEAAAIQPFAYSQLVFATAIGLGWFGETVGLNVFAGAALVTGAGLFTLWRERVRARNGARS